MDFFTSGTGDLPARPGAVRHQSQHCVLFAVDVAGFTDRRRDDQAQLAVRAALYALVPQAFDESLLGWAGCLHEDRGDGILVVIPARMPTATVVDPLLDLLRHGLRRHNKVAGPANVIRLRVAVHIGEVHRDEHGLAGTEVNHLFRLLDAPALRQALADSGGELALAASDHFYESVIRHGHGMIDPATYWRSAVHVKETRGHCWVHLPAAPHGTPALRAGTELETTSATPATREPDSTHEARDAQGRLLEDPEPPPPRHGPGLHFHGDVTVQGDVVAGNKIIYGDGA